MPDAERGRNVADLWFKIKADTSELDNAYKRLAEIEKLVANFNKELSEVEPGGKKFKELSNQLTTLEKDYENAIRKIAELDNALKSVSEAKNVVANTREITDSANEAVKVFVKYTGSLDELNKRVKELTKEYLSMNAAQKASSKGQSIINEIAILNSQRKIEADSLRALQKEYVNTQKMQDQQEGSIVALRAELSKLISSYDNLGRSMRNGTTGKELLGTIQNVTAELSEAEQASMRFNRNVGNYASGWNGLNVQVQQVARELPSLAVGVNTFFLAISNNLPMLVDELQKAQKEYATYIAEIRKGNTDVQKVAPVWKQFASSLFSWQTALVAGITILSVYGKEIISWAGSLFTAKKALSETYQATEEYQKKVGETSSSVIVTLEKLSEGWKRLGGDIDAQKKYIIDNKDAINSMGISINDAAEAEQLFNSNKDTFILGILQRAKAAATMELAAEEYKKAVQKMMEADAKSAEGASIGDKLKSWFVRSAASGDTSGYLLNADLSPEAFAKEKEEKLQKEADKYKQSMLDLIYKAMEIDEEGRKEIEKAGSKLTESLVEGSVAAIEAAMALKQQALSRVTNREDYKRIEAEIKAEQAKLDAITGGKPKKSHYVDSYQQAEEIKKASQLIKDALTKSEIDIQQQQIELMDEGSEKQLAQIRLDYEKRYQEIAKEERDLLQKLQDEERKQWEKDNPDYKKKNQQFTPTITSLTPEQREPFDKEYSLAYQKQEKDTQELLNKLLEKYRDYDAQRTAIEKSGNTEIAYLQSKRTDANANEIDRAIKVAKQKMKEGVQAVNDAEAEETSKDNSFLRNLFGDTSQMAFKDLQNLIDQAKQLQSYLSSSGDSKGLTFISAEQLKTIESSPDELDKLKKALDKLLKGGKGNEWDEIFDGFTKGFAKLKSSNGFKETSEGLQDIGEAASKASSMLGGVAGDFASMFEAMGNTGAADAMTGVQDAMTSITNIGQGFAKGGPIGGIAAAVGEAANWIGKAFAANARHKAALKEIMNEALAQQREYNLLLMQQNLEYEKAATIFGTDVYGKAANAVTVMKDAVASLNAELKGTNQQQEKFSYKNIGGVWGIIANLGYTKQKDLYSGLADIQIKTGHKKTGLFGWGKGKDTYSSILDVYPELIKANGEFDASLAETIINTREMSDESKNALQNMIDLANQAKEAYEAINDYFTDIFGDLGSTINDALVDAFTNGTDAAQTFTDSVSNMLETLAKQMIYSITLAPVMENAQKGMMDVMKNTDLSNEEKFKQWAGILDNLVDEVIDKQGDANKLLELLQKAAADKGFDIFTPENVNSAKETLESFISQMESSLNSLDVTAKDVSDNIYDYFRQAMINALYEKEYKSKMEELYKTFEDLSADGLSESDMAQLGSQVDQYIEQMMKGVEDVNSLFADKLKDNEDLQSFVDNVKSAMSSIEATAEDVTDNIFEYIRQQMVDKMFADTFQPQIEEFYKKVQDAMSDGDITDAERIALRSEAEKLANDITAAKDILSDTLGITENNLKKELEEEFKSFSDGILNSLYNAEVTAESVTKDIAESMRKELIEAMYIEQYEPRIKAIWEKWKEYSADGLVTDEERANIKTDIDELSKEVSDAAKEISDAWTDSGEEVKKAFESFSDSIKNVLYDAEATAEDVANNIYQYMRNALVDSMFTAQLQPQIQAWYDKYTEFMKDGAIDTAERKTLDEMIAEIQKAGVDIVDAANALFPSLDTGAIKRAEEAAQEAENARNEAEQEWESFSDGILNSLYDIEATAEDISDDMSEYMRKALIKAMYVENFKPQMQKWYNEWQKAMGDDNLTSEEKQLLDSMKQTMVDDMKKEVDAINQFFGTMFSQQASSKGFEAMSQDTGEELNGRFTALQVAGEEIKNQAVQQTDILNRIYERMEAPIQNMPEAHFNLIDSLAADKINDSSIDLSDIVTSLEGVMITVNNLGDIVNEIRTTQAIGWGNVNEVTENVGKIVKNTPLVNTKLDNINENIKRAI